MCGKRCPNICIELDLFGCFRIEEIRDNDNATGLKEGGGIRNVNLQCFPYTRLLALFRLNLLTMLKSRLGKISAMHALKDCTKGMRCCNSSIVMVLNVFNALVFLVLLVAGTPCIMEMVWVDVNSKWLFQKSKNRRTH